jgi:ACS family tartrate transporter-like MFS transporter
MIYVVMGVAGSGKTTIAQMLAQKLQWVFLEADQFHSAANKDKMHRGIPLTDEDRLPWLESIHAALKQNEEEGKNAVLACSALKDEYRQILSDGLGVKYIYLKGSFELIRDRMLKRHGHFAGVSILADQFATLQEPHDAIVVDVSPPPEQIVAEILRRLEEVHPGGQVMKHLLMKLRWKLLPFLFLLYVVGYLDRINVGFAALQMKDRLNFSESVYGLGASIFFVGYFLFQVPSNLILQRVGARRWIATLMVAWGIVSSSMLFIDTPKTFYVLRFLLGVAEAGFFPGVVFYLRSWFPTYARAGVIALLLTAGPISGLVGGPISGALLDWDHKSGLAGWQWMFLMEGLPAILLGGLTYIFLSDSPKTASWLSTDERGLLLEELQSEEESIELPAAKKGYAWLMNPNLWGFAVVFFGINTCTYSVSLWLPSALKAVSGFSNVVLGFLSAIPYLVASVLMVAIGTHSDRTLERRWHIAISAFVGGVALLAAGYSTGAFVSIIAFSLALSASSSMAGPSWAMASGLMTAATAAPTIALINAMGNLGGGFGPYLIGYLKHITGSFRAGLAGVAVLMFLACVTALLLNRSANHKV